MFGSRRWGCGALGAAAVAGAALGCGAASAVAAFLIESLETQLDVPVLSLHADADPPYHVERTQVQSFSTLRGWQLQSSATWQVGTNVPIDEAGHLGVDVALGDYEPVRGIIDTGAEISTISWDHLAKLGVPERVPVGHSRAITQGTSTNTPLRLLMLQRVGLGPHILADQTFALVPLDANPVVLGTTAFMSVVIELDLQENVLRINPTDAPEGTPWLDDVHTPIMFGRVGGFNVVVQIDTGADHTAITPALREALGLAWVEARASVMDVSGREISAGMVDLAGLEATGARFDTLPVVVMPLAWTSNVKDAHLAVNVGTDLLADARVIVDYPRRRVHIAR